MLDIERLRLEHHEEPWLIGTRCNRCQNPWPCDTARLLTLLTPDVVAVAELMALGTGGAWSMGQNSSGKWFIVQAAAGEKQGYATTTELLAAVKAALT